MNADNMDAHIQPDAMEHLRERVLYVGKTEYIEEAISANFDATRSYLNRTERKRSLLTVSPSTFFTAKSTLLRYWPRKYEVHISRGFIGALRDSLELWSARTAIWSQSGLPLQGQPIPEKESTAILAKNIATYFHSDTWNVSEFDVVRLKRILEEIYIPLSQRRSSSAEFLEQQAIRFVIAHELGHMRFGHPERDAKSRDDFQTREFGCDRWALDLMLDRMAEARRFYCLDDPDAHRQLWIVKLIAAIETLI